MYGIDVQCKIRFWGNVQKFIAGHLGWNKVNIIAVATIFNIFKIIVVCRNRKQLKNKQDINFCSSLQKLL